ncbi:uncharacterized protein M6B38_296810 [Iris pallida]|uniref:Remorin C-terminal domain-containing protein n=1 Tax=Iris pallida TaxID=29817 RepID=A0AAX6HT76_IRIPA|nr:uncharacterized protein M6B38_296810 [Iris pallida]
MASKPWKQNDHHGGGDGAGRDESADREQRGGEAEEEPVNPLAIVPASTENHRPATPAAPADAAPAAAGIGGGAGQRASVRQVRKEEVESKIAAWEAAELAKVHNRFKREEAIITGWEDEQVEKATACLRKIERKLEEEKARAVERMRNDVAVARQKAEEKRASVEAKRGEKLARVLELGKLMKIVGKPPSKRSFF